MRGQVLGGEGPHVEIASGDGSVEGGLGSALSSSAQAAWSGSAVLAAASSTPVSTIMTYRPKLSASISSAFLACRGPVDAPSAT